MTDDKKYKIMQLEIEGRKL